VKLAEPGRLKLSACEANLGRYKSLNYLLLMKKYGPHYREIIGITAHLKWKKFH